METNKRKALGKGLEQLFSNESLYVNPLETLDEIEPDYSKHISIINKQYDKKYYNVFDIKNPIRYSVLKFIYTIFGFRAVKTIMNLYIRFFK